MTAMPHLNPDAGRYALVITNDGQLVTNTVHTTRAERRDACVEVLQETCNDVRKDEITDILLTFGGADPDSAISEISALYADFGVDVYLEDQAVPEEPVAGVPVAMYSVLQSFDNSSMNSIIHFPTTAARHDHLRRQLNRLSKATDSAVPDQTLSETETAAQIEVIYNGLIDQKTSFHLVTSFVPNWL